MKVPLQLPVAPVDPLIAVSCNVFGLTVTTLACPDLAVVILLPPLVKFTTLPPDTVVMPTSRD